MTGDEHPGNSCKERDGDDAAKKRVKNRDAAKDKRRGDRGWEE